MTNIRRGFGFVADAVAGGSDFDTLGAGVGAPELKAIPSPSTFWPVTGGTLDKNLERIDRNDEVRGRRANTSPLPFRAAPQVTVPCRAYRRVVEKALFYCMGGTDTVVGIAAPYSHSASPAGYGTVALPAIHVGVIRDDLYYKMSGGVFNRVSLNFPLDGEGTCEMEIWGLYHQLFAAAPPTATYGQNYDDVFMLRDAEAFIDGSGTAIPDLQGVEFTFTNNLLRKFYAKRNVGIQILGSTIVGPPAQELERTRKLWFPAQNKLGAAQDVTVALTFGNTNTAQELAEEYAQIEKIVFDVEGGPLPSGGSEILRITAWNTVWTGGGASDLSARDDITSRFEGGVFYDETVTKDITVEIVNDDAAAIVA